MRGLWLEHGSLRYCQDLPNPVQGVGEALVRVQVAGICQTDLELLKGYYPFCGVPGHEFVGVVEGVSHNHQLLGRRVVGRINAACGTCSFCRQDIPEHCESRTVLGIAGRDGAFAEYLTLPIANLLQVPEQVSDRQAVFVEPLAASLQILEQVHLRPGQSVLLIGAGKLGQLIARVLVWTGTRPSVVCRHSEQRRALDPLGIDLLSEDECPVKWADVVIDASGSPQGFTLARQAVRPRGTIVLKSTYADASEINLSQLVVDEITVVGSRCGPFKPAISLLKNGLDPTPLIHGEFPLSEGIQACVEAGIPGKSKVLIQVTD